MWWHGRRPAPSRALPTSMPATPSASPSGRCRPCNAKATASSLNGRRDFRAVSYLRPPRRTLRCPGWRTAFQRSSDQQTLRTPLGQVRDEVAAVGGARFREDDDHYLATRFHVAHDAGVGIDRTPRAALRVDLEAAHACRAARDADREVVLLGGIAPHATAHDGRVRRRERTVGGE